MTPRPPRTIDELLLRAEALAGHTLADIARGAYIGVPTDPRRAKGWAGQLLERVLGATAASRAEVDFPGLGVEMKSVPVEPSGRPTEATYVCVAPLEVGALGTWETSWVRAKLRCVLWIPLVEASPERGLAGRVVGAPVLWSPSEEEERLLRTDWEEVANIVAHGELWRLHARMGQVLQVRPKAADGAETTWAQDEQGWVRDTPRGFYLRPSFTGAVLARWLVGSPRG